MHIMARKIQITFDAANARTLADFWAEALGYVRQPPPSKFDSWEEFAIDKGIPAEDWEKYDALVDPDGSGPRILFQKVPEAKSAKNRVHLDVKVTIRGATDAKRRAAIDQEAERLVGLGATEIEDFDNGDSDGVWTVMHDPEGNEFCIH